ncbi:eukaryotic translation initiation factor 2alpha kinase [Aureococcus anophagefferens]|uniref:Eukaryotic translation initiation factor 2alpha kinase n=1 Tax=Aureococcus anophagefferens TaxID=44056 RepID=A0ABR1G2P9_AURAN
MQNPFSAFVDDSTEGGDDSVVDGAENVERRREELEALEAIYGEEKVWVEGDGGDALGVVCVTLEPAAWARGARAAATASPSLPGGGRGYPESRPLAFDVRVAAADRAAVPTKTLTGLRARLDGAWIEGLEAPREPEMAFEDFDLCQNFSEDDGSDSSSDDDDALGSSTRASAVDRKFGGCLYIQMEYCATTLRQAIDSGRLAGRREGRATPTSLAGTERAWSESSATGGAMDDTMTSLTRGVGTHYDHAADMYSLGIVAFEVAHAPWDTAMERVEHIQALRRAGDRPRRRRRASSRADADATAAALVVALVRQDPGERPGAAALLEGPLLPARAELERPLLERARRRRAGTRSARRAAPSWDALFDAPTPEVVDLGFDASDDDGAKPAARRRRAAARGHDFGRRAAGRRRARGSSAVVALLERHGCVPFDAPRGRGRRRGATAATATAACRCSTRAAPCSCCPTKSTPGRAARVARRALARPHFGACRRYAAGRVFAARPGARGAARPRERREIAFDVAATAAGREAERRGALRRGPGPRGGGRGARRGARRRAREEDARPRRRCTAPRGGRENGGPARASPSTRRSRWRGPSPAARASRCRCGRNVVAAGGRYDDALARHASPLDRGAADAAAVAVGCRVDVDALARAAAAAADAAPP